MSKKRQAVVRTVVVEKNPNSYSKALEEVKKVSGFTAALPLRAASAGAAVEYEFLVSDEMSDCETELMTMRLEAEGFGRR